MSKIDYLYNKSKKKLIYILNCSFGFHIWFLSLHLRKIYRRFSEKYRLRASLLFTWFRVTEFFLTPFVPTGRWIHVTSCLLPRVPHAIVCVYISSCDSSVYYINPLRRAPPVGALRLAGAIEWPQIKIHFYAVKNIFFCGTHNLFSQTLRTYWWISHIFYIHF